MTIDTHRAPARTTRPATIDTPAPGLHHGRIFGALVLAAFVLYGVGSGMLDQPLGLSLVILNSIAVCVIGVIGFTVLRPTTRRIGALYLISRIVEGVALATGAALVVFADLTDAATTGYLIAMFVLGIGSIPFFLTLGRLRVLPRWLTTWGVVGYVALAIGAAIELTTGSEVTVIFAIPGGLFEAMLGAYLLRYGFGLRTAA